ncbi:MAG TPA: hypothetical protein VFX53_12245, partial [Pedococcus sp.]|nr:hypothetical protein [Pedococcus sp.]
MATRVRLGFALIALALSALVHQLIQALPWILLVTTLDLAATVLLATPGGAKASRVRRIQALVIIGAAAVSSGVAMAYGGTGTKALILIPAFNAGLNYGARGALSITALGAATGFGATWMFDLEVTEQSGTRMLLWSLGAGVVGLLGALSRRMEVDSTPPAVDPSLAAEASMLLRRLHELADSLDTGFDAPASAEMALQDLAARTRSARSAILVGYGSDPAVPLAIRGADRTPWPNPAEPNSVLWSAWQDGTPTLTEWDEDLIPRSLIAVALRDEAGKRLGLLV